MLASISGACLNRVMLHLFRLAICCLLFCALNVAARQETAPVKAAIEDFLRIQIKGLPGEASFSIGTIEAQNNLASCPSLAVSLPPGARAWGHTNVLVRCQADGGWSIFVAVQVRVLADYLVTVRPLTQGQVVAEADLVKIRGDLTDLPTGILTESAQAIGKTVVQSVSSGRPLRSDMLRLALAIQPGQSVKVVAKGQGFQVAGGEGRALSGAAEGQLVQVRLPQGRVVSGIARTGGVVEIAY